VQHLGAGPVPGALGSNGVLKGSVPLLDAAVQLANMSLQGKSPRRHEGPHGLLHCLQNNDLYATPKAR
jgi:hypothetical protein